MRFIREHRLEVAIFCIALAARLALFLVNFNVNDGELLPTIKGDDGYYELSQGIMGGRGFTWDTEPPYHPNSLRPPVWPYLIAFFAKVFGSYWAVFAFEIILGSFIPVMAFYLASRLWGRRVGKWAALIMCFEPYLVLFSFIIYTETSFIFFFLLSLIFLLRYMERQTYRSAIWFGVFLGLATLIKPTVQYLPILIPLGLAIVWRKELCREHLKHAAAFALVFLALFLPWVGRNKVEFGVWGVSAQPAFNLYVYLVPTVRAIDNGTGFQEELEKHLPKDFDANTINLENSEIYKKEAIEILKDHPTALLKSGLTTLLTFFTHDGMLTVLGYSDVRVESLGKPAIYLLSHPFELVKAIIFYIQTPGAVILVMRAFWWAVTILFIFGLFRYFKREGARPAAILVVCLILYFAATTAINGLGVNARFRMPVEVFILGFALYGLFSLKRDNTAILK